MLRCPGVPSNKFAPFLLLLVCCTQVDDHWAALTPDPADKELAAENNTFVGGVSAGRIERPCAGGPPVPSEGRRPARLSVEPVPSVRPWPAYLWPLFGPDPLYALMSRRR